MRGLRDARVTLPDGRSLAYTEWGVPHGRPVMYFHGRPGSRLWCPDERATAAAGVRLIVPDRPGIGRSDPLEGRTLADWPSDVEALADALGISAFAVIGVSGGGAYALACAALIPGRLAGAADVSSGLAEFDWAERPGIEERWLPRMRARFVLAQSDPAAAARRAAEHWTSFIEPEWQPDVARKELEAVEGDRWFFEDPTRAAAFDAQTREWWRQGPSAISWDLMDLLLPWGFRFADISIPLTVFHGIQDPWVKAEDVEFEARAIPNGVAVIWPDSGHLGFVKHWNEILEAVA